ncbi:MAG: hypothetical protein M1838_001117 [Thelocarpon superellum]|nr:MAG: hypothetical protein M1838_001117 [Thelocarpon superellum]
MTDAADRLIRRVKCDEEKPACARCRNTGRTCDGYLVSPPIDPPIHPPQGAGTQHRALVIAPGPSLEIPGGPQERRCFRFFRDRTVPQLSGYFSSEFWSRLLLQATHHDPIIRHAVLAVGASHERFEMLGPGPGADHDPGAFALEHYNKSIRGLSRAMSGRGKMAADVALTSCVLFTCFETLQDRYGSAIVHMKGGVKMMADLERAERAEGQREGAGENQSPGHANLVWAPDAYLPRHYLEVIFTRLDMQLMQMANGPYETFQLHASNTQPGFGPEVPSEFSSIEEARNNADFHGTRYLHAVERCSHATPGDDQDSIFMIQADYGATIERWFAAFEVFLEKMGPNLSAEELNGALVLKIQQQIHGLVTKIQYWPMPADEMIWDEFLPVFDQIVTLARVVVRASTQLSQIKPGRRTFSMDPGIVRPLFLTAFRARDPQLRRAAVALLDQTPRQESVWGANVLASCARYIIALEEGDREIRTAADVPAFSRINMVQPTFDFLGGKLVMTYTRRTEDSKSEVFSQVLTW